MTKNEKDELKERNVDMTMPCHKGRDQPLHKMYLIRHSALAKAVNVLVHPLLPKARPSLVSGISTVFLAATKMELQVVYRRVNTEYRNPR